ncbi:MAG TPA: hypothetical protein VHZ96_09935 [Frankiaceae bacterium]|jgi:hypothetical protein|nr:hypothetical protein [Frankiaceae bacterium]
MSFTDWVIDLALIAIVLRQIRWNRVDLRFILLPLGLVAWAATSYLKAIPTAGNDLVLIGVLTAIGFTFGGLSALASDVRAEAGAAYVRARGLAVGLWIAGVGSRIAFSLYAQNGGGSSVTHFSAAHHITTIAAWTDGLVLMALAEVITRLAILVWRGQRAVRAERSSSVSVRTFERVSV